VIMCLPTGNRESRQSSGFAEEDSVTRQLSSSVLAVTGRRLATTRLGDYPNRIREGSRIIRFVTGHIPLELSVGFSNR
jgi:hypothetical protein